ncbi:MAG: hypothetical protein ACJ8R9_31090 [Steroidobacteraceae bacterium]
MHAELSTDPLNDLPQARAFLQAIDPLVRAYRHGTFTFVALMHQGEKVILRAQLRLTVDAPTRIKHPVETTRLFAGQVALALDATAAKTCLRSAITGNWLPLVGDHLLKLLPRTQPPITPGYSGYHEPADPVHVRVKGAVERFVLSGINRDQLIGVQMTDVAGDLRELGLDSPAGIFRAYGLEGSDETTLEIIASPVVRIEPGSVVSGRRVQVRIVLANDLPPDRLRITARNADPKVADMPWSITGPSLNWSTGGSYHSAQWEFDLPQDAVLDCTAVYAGRVHSEMRLADPTSTPNRLWRVLGLVDPKLERLNEVLLTPKKKDKDARDFETGASWLLQLLGFATVHLGGMSGLNKEPDVLAQAPNGDVILVECTIDVPDDDKLTKLISRAAKLTELLRTSESAGDVITITPILMCPLSPDELAGIRAKAAKHSIQILYQEDIAEALRLAKFHPDANSVLQHWRGRALRQIQTQGISASGMSE